MVLRNVQKWTVLLYPPHNIIHIHIQIQLYTSSRYLLISIQHTKHEWIFDGESFSNFFYPVDLWNLIWNKERQRGALCSDMFSTTLMYGGFNAQWVGTVLHFHTILLFTCRQTLLFILKFIYIYFLLRIAARTSCNWAILSLFCTDKQIFLKSFVNFPNVTWRLTNDFISTDPFKM